AGEGEAVGEHPQPEVVVLVVGCGEEHGGTALWWGETLDALRAGFHDAAHDATDEVFLPHLHGAGLPAGAGGDEQITEDVVEVADGHGAVVERPERRLHRPDPVEASDHRLE